MVRLDFVPENCSSCAGCQGRAGKSAAAGCQVTPVSKRCSCHSGLLPKSVTGTLIGVADMYTIFDPVVWSKAGFVSCKNRGRSGSFRVCASKWGTLACSVPFDLGCDRCTCQRFVPRDANAVGKKMTMSNLPYKFVDIISINSLQVSVNQL